jgi:hypothetical protein
MSSGRYRNLLLRAGNFPLKRPNSTMSGKGKGAKPAPPSEPAPEGFQLIREGKAAMLFPTGNEVFYNKVQVSPSQRQRSGLAHT